MCPRVWEGIEAHGWKGSRIVWADGKVGIVKRAVLCVCVCVYVCVTIRKVCVW